jgi:hypothetical protein
MLFIYDDQAEIFKLDILLEQPVGSDQDVDRAPGGLLEISFEFKKRLIISMRTG